MRYTQIIFCILFLTALAYAGLRTDADCKDFCNSQELTFKGWIARSDIADCESMPSASISTEGLTAEGKLTKICRISGEQVAGYLCACATQCADVVDNDGDGKVDMSDGGCTEKTDKNEQTKCQDKIDNDADGKTDLLDAGCNNEDDDDEVGQCQDTNDNDGDGKIDLADPGCADAADNDEKGQCQDSVDNDAGGKIDMEDPGCSDPSDNDEVGECQDTKDNDGDTKIDLADTNCADAEDPSEAGKACNFAIKIAGGVNQDNLHLKYWLHTLQKYDYLRSLGFSDEEIYILHYNGTTNPGANRTEIIDGPARNEADIERVFNEIIEKIKKCAENGDSSEVLIFGGNHGSTDGLSLVGGNHLTPQKLKELIEKLRQAGANRVWVEMPQCHSGVFTEALKGVADGVAVSSQSNETTSSTHDGKNGFEPYFIDSLKNSTGTIVDTDGDGKISWEEAANYSINRTKAENRSTGNLTLKEPICGDGVVAIASRFAKGGEECDPGNQTAGIPPGKPLCPRIARCNNECKCMPIEIPTPTKINDTLNGSVDQTSNGTIPENVTHTVCNYENQTCVSVAGAGVNQCTSNSQCINNTRLCGNGVKEQGELCDSNTDCRMQIGERTVSGTCTQGCTKCEYTLYCGDGIIYGNEQCEQNSDCSSGMMCSSCRCVPIPTHNICNFETGSCQVVEGVGADQCGSDADCKPPVINCPSYCSSQGFSQSLGSSYSNIEICQAAAQEEAQVCTTLCIFTKFYTASNQAGTTTCCCKHTVTLPCSDCPGENPVCPPESTCEQYQPGSS